MQTAGAFKGLKGSAAQNDVATFFGFLSFILCKNGPVCSRKKADAGPSMISAGKVL